MDIRSLFLILTIFFSSYTFALSNEARKHEQDLTDIAKSRCDSQQIEGRDFTKKVLANGNLEIRFLGKKGVGLDGAFVYTEAEWKGRQSVLKAHQAVENIDRRNCIREEMNSLRKSYQAPKSGQTVDNSILKEIKEGSFSETIGASPHFWKFIFEVNPIAQEVFEFKVYEHKLINYAKSCNFNLRGDQSIFYCELPVIDVGGNVIVANYTAPNIRVGSTVSVDKKTGNIYFTGQLIATNFAEKRMNRELIGRIY